MDVSEARRILGVDTSADLLTLARARDRSRQPFAPSGATADPASDEQQAHLDEQARVNEAYILLAGLKAPRPGIRVESTEAAPRDGWFWILVVAGAICGGALTKIGAPPSGPPEVSQSIEWIGFAVVGAVIGALLRWVVFRLRLRSRARRRAKLLSGRQ
jgi:hypothetical protein